MTEDQIIRILTKLGASKFRANYKGVTTNCPLHWRHAKGGDANPSMFIYTTDPASDDTSTASCMACLYRGSVADLCWEYKMHHGTGNDLVEYADRIDMGDDSMSFAESIPDFEDTPNFIRHNKSLQTAVKKQRKIECNTLIVPSTKFEVCTLDYGIPKSVTKEDVRGLVEPFLNDIPKYWGDRGYDTLMARKWNIGYQTKLWYKKFKNNKHYYMNFGPRLLFTISDHEKDFVGWSARAITSTESFESTKHYDGNPLYNTTGKPKYLHCPGFKRNHYLYGEDQIDHSNDTCILVEGFFDVLNLDKCGYSNGLGVMGTHVDSLQIAKILKWFKRVVLFPDGDQPGIDAMKKAKEKLEEKISVILVDAQLYLGKDPGDLSKKEIDDILSKYF